MSSAPTPSGRIAEPVSPSSDRRPFQSSVLDSTGVSSHSVRSPTVTCLGPSPASPPVDGLPEASPNGSLSTTGHSTNGVPVTLARSVCLSLVNPVSVPVTSTLWPGLRTSVDQLSGYLRSFTSPSPTMVWSSSFRSLALNHAPCPSSSLLVLVILNASSNESPSILSACLTSSRSPSFSPDSASYFSRCRLGGMSGVRVHTTLDSRSLSLKCSVNRFSTRSAVLMRLHWMYARQPFSWAVSAETSLR